MLTNASTATSPPFFEVFPLQNGTVLKRPPPQRAVPVPQWTFLTNHAHVLLCIASEPQLLMRDVADRVGITERAVQRIVADLEDAGYLVRQRVGRRNEYSIKGDLPLRHPVERHQRVTALIALARKR